MLIFAEVGIIVLFLTGIAIQSPGVPTGKYAEKRGPLGEAKSRQAEIG